ncbi:cell wall-binding repeat-containing protein [Plantactinospora sp. S1510]|uniref:Cell wall-binding repeat-containing protein n=1 Tax=Plantactinospora alkalitolerans TaxID=2789879 RepID=A0ABS0H4R9_9ACTN|nr:cell wall-binding repeat-containing protein [Plantactinospora alkalitolerans]MBF9133306.1 cell wall-binding repeat-containing protein [Plantactinospora alkalitolerans]
MTPRLPHRPLALASVLALGAATVLGGTTAATASPGGDGEVLSASNGTNTLRFASGETLTVAQVIDGASWSPDGSRLIYSNVGHQIVTIRFDDASNHFIVSPYIMAPPEDTLVDRRDPSYRGNGVEAVWAGKEAGKPWRLEVQRAVSGNAPTTFSPQDGRHYLRPDAGPGDLVVYQTQAGSADAPSGRSDVGIYDPSFGFRTIVENASNPAISPDGTRVAFVRADDSGRNQVWAADVDGDNVVPVTSNAANHDNPAWSPIGRTIAFSQDTGVATAPADGSGAGNPTVVAGLSGVPAYQPRRLDTVARLTGQNRHTTAVAVSRSHWANVADGADVRQAAGAVVLSRSDLYADALGGGALAAAKQGPLLLTPPDALDDATRTEIQRILAPGRTVYLLGSPGALSTTVQTQVEALGYQVERLAGQDRYTTSIAIANEIDPTPDLILTATGADFPDALAAGAAAGSYNTPGSARSAVVVLTKDYTLIPATRSYLDPLSERSLIFGIGLQASIATKPYVPIEIIGRNRYETAWYTGWFFFGATPYVGVATGLDWPDALAGGALMGTIRSPLLLTRGTDPNLSTEVEWYLDENSGTVHTGLVFGGPSVVPADQQTRIGSRISGPGGFTQRENVTDVGISGAVVPADGARGAARQPTTGVPGPRTPEELKALVAELNERTSR